MTCVTNKDSQFVREEENVVHVHLDNLKEFIFIIWSPEFIGEWNVFSINFGFVEVV